jgi:ABC-2 type transport system permease protein
MITAILRAQWLTIHSFRMGSGRGGAIFFNFISAIWYGFWAVLGVAAGSFTSDPGSQAAIQANLPRGFMFIVLYWQFAPILAASLGASLDMKKLLVYPIPHSKLFFVEVLLRLTTGLEMLLLLTGITAGLILNPRFGGWVKGPQLILPILLFVGFNLLLAAGLRSLFERLMTQKRLREVLVLLLVMAAAVPQLVLVTGLPAGTLRRIFSDRPSALWPWVTTARLALFGYSASDWAVLAGWSAFAYLFSRWQFERNLRYDTQAVLATQSSGKGSRSSWAEGLYRLPAMLLPDPVGAIVEKELRSLSRTPRFRLVFMMGFTFGLAVWLPMIFRRHEQGDSPIVENFLTLVCVYALTLLGQVSYWNAFGFDRSAVQTYFCVPVPISRALLGKNVAAAIFIVLEMGAVILACILFRMQTTPSKIGEAVVVTIIVGFYLMAAGNLSSVHFPRPLNPEKVAQGGSAGRMQALMFLFYPIALLPVLLAYWARYALQSTAMFYAVLGFAAVLGAIVYWIAMESATQTAERRREVLVTELSKSEGPVVLE